MMSARILLTGATGYVGGTILSRLMANERGLFKESSVTLLIRGRARAQKLEEQYGPRITCILFSDWNELELLSEVASRHHIVINAASGFHPPSAEALVQGLARRSTKRQEAWMIHTSGCSNISDRPLTGTCRPHVEYCDEDSEGVYRFEKFLELSEGSYPQRTSELLVIDKGLETGINVMSIQAPCIFGRGEGLFQDAGLIIPIMMAYVLSRGYGFSLGPETATIDYVHVADLADLYLLCVEHLLVNGGVDLPSGKAGILFPTAGRITMRDVAKGCVEMAFRKGALPKDEIGPQKPEVWAVSLAEAATTTAGDLSVAESGWAGHRKTKGTMGKRLGWRPIHGEKSWNKDLEDELDLALRSERHVTIDNCIAQRQ